MNVKQMMKQSVKQKNQQKNKIKMSKFDIFKWIFIFLLFFTGLFVNYYYNQYPLSIRIIGWLILAGVLFGIAFKTPQGQKAWKFFREAQTEIKKVVWPTRQETFQMTLVIIAIVVAFSLVIWVIDMFLMWAVSWLTGQL